MGTQTVSPVFLGGMTEGSFAAMDTYGQDLSASDSSKKSKNSLTGRHFGWGSAVGPHVVNPAGLFRSQVSAEILKSSSGMVASVRLVELCKEGEQEPFPSVASETDYLRSKPALALLSSVTLAGC